MDFCRKSDAQRAFGTGRFKIAFIESELDDFSGDGGGFAGDFLHAGAWNFALIYQRACHVHDFFAIAVEVQSLKLKVTFHARAQRGQAEQAAHKVDLIKHCFEEEHAEVGQSSIREVAAAVEVASAATVGSFQLGVVALLPTGESTR